MALSFLLDTSAYSAFLRGSHEVAPWFDAENDIAVPVIVIGELRSGFAIGSRREENEKLLMRFLETPNVRVLDLDMGTTSHFASLYRETRSKGVAVGTNDLWIAALAQQHKLPILTLDQDFERIPSIETLGGLLHK